MKFLTSEAKERYMEDFNENVLTCKHKEKHIYYFGIICLKSLQVKKLLLPLYYENRFSQ